MNSSRPALRIVSYWEKLAGGSLALAAAVALSRMSGFDLVEPDTRSSLIGVFEEGGLPLSAYYNTHRLRAALAPQRLLQTSRWQQLVESTPLRQRTSVILVYPDFPRNCTNGMPNRAGLARCPGACTARVERELYDSFLLSTAGWPISCLRASTLREAAASRSIQLFGRYRAVQIVNFRRHEDGKPMVKGLLRLRAQTIRPAAALRAAAHAFLRRSGIQPGDYTVVQLRSNHLAHEEFLAGPRNCSQRVKACVGKLQQSAIDLAPGSKIIIATDIATINDRSQDGDSHRRHPYVRRCLKPVLPWLKNWYSLGIHFSCAVGSTIRIHAQKQQVVAGLSDGACDAGVLGLIDL